MPSCSPLFLQAGWVGPLVAFFPFLPFFAIGLTAGWPQESQLDKVARQSTRRARLMGLAGRSVKSKRASLETRPRTSHRARELLQDQNRRFRSLLLPSRLPGYRIELRSWAMNEQNQDRPSVLGARRHKPECLSRMCTRIREVWAKGQENRRQGKPVKISASTVKTAGLSASLIFPPIEIELVFCAREGKCGTWARTEDSHAGTRFMVSILVSIFQS